MDWLDRMNRAMDYIEENLTAEIDFKQVSKMACCSVFHFQRMFSFIINIPLSEYIRRRRLTKAAFELQNSEIKVIDVALKYGYDSPEAFSRAFKSMHGISPTLSRDKGVTLKAYPRLSFQISIKGDMEMNYRIEEKVEFKLTGVVTEISTENGQNFIQIPEFWEKCMEDGTIECLMKDMELEEDACLSAALYDFHEGAFSYMICWETPAQSAPKGYSTLSVPAATWAVFPTPEHNSEEVKEQIQSLCKRIFTEWFPTSGYEHADSPELERYYNKGNGKFMSEIWIPVVKK